MLKSRKSSYIEIVPGLISHVIDFMSGVFSIGIHHPDSRAPPSKVHPTTGKAEAYEVCAE